MAIIRTTSGVLYGFIQRRSSDFKIDWIIKYYSKLKEQQLNSIELVNFLICATLSKELIGFLGQQSQNIQTLYWKKVRAILYHLETPEKEHSLRKFIEVGRFNTAITELEHFVKELSTEFIIFVLESKANQTKTDDSFLRSHEIEHIFKEIYKRNNYNRSRLEWSYLPCFGFYQGRRDNTVLLLEELASSHQFFVDILKLLYKRKDEKENILGSVKKAIPKKTPLIKWHWPIMPILCFLRGKNFQE